MTDSGTDPSGKSYAERIVAMSLPLPVGADMIALAILVVAVSGSMLLDELGVAVPAALGAMVVSVALAFILLAIAIAGKICPPVPPPDMITLRNGIF